MTISLAAALIQRSCNRQPRGDRLIPIQRAPGSPAGLQPGQVELRAQRDKVALVDDVLLGIEPVVCACSASTAPRSRAARTGSPCCWAAKPSLWSISRAKL